MFNKTKLIAVSLVLALAVIVSWLSISEARRSAANDTSTAVYMPGSSTPPLPVEELVATPPKPAENPIWQSPPAMGLVRVRDIVPDIRIALKYATRDNFTGVNLYGEGADAWLQPEVAEMLKTSQGKLKSLNPELTLVVYDAARPQSVQRIMWDVVKGTPNQPYVASPGSISLHAYGAAVDISIWDTTLNSPLDMGTPFDSFSPESQPALEQDMLSGGKLSQSQIENRNLLRSVMKGAGFHSLSTEWWHFNAFTREETKKRFKPVP